MKKHDDITDDTAQKCAHYLSLGLDCNVSIQEYKDSVGLLFSELVGAGWLISPPAASPQFQRNSGNLKQKQSNFPEPPELGSELINH
jgi:hypothetical protein